MDNDLVNIRNVLHALSGQLAAYEMLCLALVATHPDRPRLLDAFTTSANLADAVFEKRLDDPTTLRQHFDAAYNQIVSVLRKPGVV